MKLTNIIVLLAFVVNLVNCLLHFNNLLFVNTTNNYNINYNTIFSKLSCIHFVQITNVSESNSILASLHSSKTSSIPVLLINPPSEKLNLDKFNCNFYIIFINSTYTLTKLFSHKIFKNFAKILLVFKNLTSPEINLVVSDRQLLIKSAIDLKWIDYDDLVRNNFHINDLYGYYEKNESVYDEDKFIDRMIRNENDGIEIRVSLFECPPYVIYNREPNTNFRMDGSEFRSLKQIAKNWKIMFTHRDRSTNIRDPWSVSLNDLDKNISDVSMCSIWLSQYHYKYYDTSEFIDFQCITFLVPKPLISTQASIIYLPYRASVWFIFYVMLVVTMALIKLSSWLIIKIHENLFGDCKFKNVSVILFEMINIMTGHGLVSFPKYLSFKILFISWIVLSFLIDVGYVTGYTSLLTIPRYSKSIDTINDFIEQDIQWGEGNESSYKIELLRTENINFIKLAELFIVEESEEERYRLLTGHKYSRIVKIISNSFVTDTYLFGPHITGLQPMKTCLFEYYTTFAFPKSSPFKNIFDRQILRMREAGLFQAWFRDIIFRYADDYMKRIFDRHIDSTNGNITLTMSHLTGAFYIWCIGLSIAVFAFIGEFVWMSVTKKNYF